MVNLQSNVKLPQRKQVMRDAQRQTAIFKAYAEAYAALYVQRPTGFTMQGDMMRIHIHGVFEIGSEKRIKQLTNMMRSRLQS